MQSLFFFLGGSEVLGFARWPVVQPSAAPGPVLFAEEALQRSSAVGSKHLTKLSGSRSWESLTGEAV